MKDLSNITHKFYKSEGERLRKITEKKDVIKAVGTALKDTIYKLYAWKIKFFVFETVEDASPPVMHAGLVYCCGEKEDVEVNALIRAEIEKEIVEKTIYKQIIWEI